MPSDPLTGGSKGPTILPGIRNEDQVLYLHVMECSVSLMSEADIKRQVHGWAATVTETCMLVSGCVIRVQKKKKHTFNKRGNEHSTKISCAITYSTPGN